MNEAHEAGQQRTPARKKAQQLARHLRGERPDYAYLKQVFRHLREELAIAIPRAPQRLPHVPSEEEMVATTRSCGRPGTSATWC